MGIYSSGNKYRTRAKQYEQYARDIETVQRDVDFGRNLLANIRQQRLASAELAAYNYSDDFVSSSAAGAQANLASTLAGEMTYAYETSERAEQIQNLQQAAQLMYKKYAKQQRRRATAIQVTGAAVGALGGGLIGGSLMAAAIGGQIGLGTGQVAAGNTAQGISNILSGMSKIGSPSGGDDSGGDRQSSNVSESGGMISTYSYSRGGKYMNRSQFAGLYA